MRGKQATFVPSPPLAVNPQGKRGFDAYWTPLFGDGSFAAQLCEAGGGGPWLVGWNVPGRGSGRVGTGRVPVTFYPVSCFFIGHELLFPVI